MPKKSDNTPLLKDIWESRGLIFSLAKSDFKGKYACSVFGIISYFVLNIIVFGIYGTLLLPVLY